jgi:hypothetical protein
VDFEGYQKTAMSSSKHLPGEALFSDAAFGQVISSSRAVGIVRTLFRDVPAIHACNYPDLMGDDLVRMVPVLEDYLAHCVQRILSWNPRICRVQFRF